MSASGIVLSVAILPGAYLLVSPGESLYAQFGRIMATEKIVVFCKIMV